MLLLILGWCPKGSKRMSHRMPRLTMARYPITKLAPMLQPLALRMSSHSACGSSTPRMAKVNNRTPMPSIPAYFNTLPRDALMPSIGWFLYPETPRSA